MTATYSGRPVPTRAAHPDIIPEENLMTDTDDWLTRHYAELDAVDWHDVPAGRYAYPVCEDDLDDDHPDFCRVLGYKIFERKTPKVSKTGRRTGKNSWATRLLLAPGVQWDSFRAYLDRTKAGDGYDDRCDIAAILDNPDAWMRTFGQVVGRCGACGKTLTDPDSKAYGVGPECRRPPGPFYSEEEIKGAVRGAVEATEPGDTVRTWTWERPIQGRARKREKVTAQLHSGGLGETCCTVLERLNDGRERCGDPVVWSVQRVGSSGYRSYYCDADLPAEYRPDATPAVEADEGALF